MIRKIIVPFKVLRSNLILQENEMIMVSEFDHELLAAKSSVEHRGIFDNDVISFYHGKTCSFRSARFIDIVLNSVEVNLYE